jgi:demethylmenaquinone methyltransferase/2-methoxy-6-polyprenyl-1,4-benzoquinol methylase
MDEARAEFFDAIAEQWDGWDDLEALHRRLAEGLDEFAVRPDETVLDVGCGTGNLTRALLARLSEQGRVVAIDSAKRMIEVARRKIMDPRVTWKYADARRLPLPDRSFDRVICYSVWPHFGDPEEVARELGRVLRPGGSLHVWHLVSRGRVNEIHAAGGPAVRNDRLGPAVETAGLLTGLGFAVQAVIDDDQRYLVTAAKQHRQVE